MYKKHSVNHRREIDFESFIHLLNELGELFYED